MEQLDWSIYNRFLDPKEPFCVLGLSIVSTLNFDTCAIALDVLEQAIRSCKALKSLRCEYVGQMCEKQFGDNNNYNHRKCKAHSKPTEMLSGA